MPVLENSRHELFCQNVASGMSLTEAYREAGYKNNRQAASRLLSNVDVDARIQEIRENAASKAEIDRAFVLDLIQDIITEARDNGQYGPAMTGAVKLGVDIGMFEQKTANKHYFKPVDQMNEEELAAFLGSKT